MLTDGGYPPPVTSQSVTGRQRKGGPAQTPAVPVFVPIPMVPGF